MTADSTLTRKWLVALGHLCATPSNGEEASARVDAMGPMLANRFPQWVWNRDSLEHVAAQCRWFPAYAECVEHVRAWMRDNPERGPERIAAPVHEPPPRRPCPTAEEVAAVQRAMAEFKAEMAAKRIADTPARGVLRPSHLHGEALAAARAAVARR